MTGVQAWAAARHAQLRTNLAGSRVREACIIFDRFCPAPADTPRPPGLNDARVAGLLARGSSPGARPSRIRGSSGCTIERRLAAYSCGGSHGLGPTCRDRTAPRSLSPMPGCPRAGHHDTRSFPPCGGGKPTLAILTTACRMCRCKAHSDAPVVGGWTPGETTGADRLTQHRREASSVVVILTPCAYPKITPGSQVAIPGNSARIVKPISWMPTKGRAPR